MKEAMKNKKGVTLVELLVVVGILAIIMGAAFTVMTTGIRTYNMNLSATVDQQNLRTAMAKLTKQVRNAPAGAVSVSGAVLTVSSKSFTVTGGMLMHGGTALAGGISSIKAGYKADTSNKVIQVDLTAEDGTVLSAQIRVN